MKKRILIINVLLAALLGATACVPNKEALLKQAQCLESYRQREDLKGKCMIRCRMPSIGCNNAHQSCLEHELGQKICGSK